MENPFVTSMTDGTPDMAEMALQIYSVMRKGGADKKNALISTRATMLAQVSMVNQLLEDLVDLSEVK